MAYRCPYCHEMIGVNKLPSCPSCGRMMRYAERRTTAERRDDKRKIKLMEREALRRRSAFDVEKMAGFLGNPRKALVAVFAVLLLAVLGYMAFQPGRGIEEAKREEVAERHLNTLAVALARYRFHTGQWPSTNAGLDALIHDDGAPGWDGPYLADRLQLPVQQVAPDPWKEPYVYGLDEEGGVILFSKGADMTAGTASDLRPDPQSFVLADMSWTNEWVGAEERLPIRVKILPNPQ